MLAAHSCCAALLWLVRRSEHLGWRTLLPCTLSLSMLCTGAGVKDLLAGEQQAAVTVALEGLLDTRGAGAADAQDFSTYDPKVSYLTGRDQVRNSFG